jgi:hypothetical protein
VAHLHTTIAEVTGSEPVTCPWRVYDDPVVQAGRALLGRVESGVVDIDRQLAVVVDAADSIGNISAHLVALELRRKSEARTAEDNMRNAGRA